jgi:hypothetical protein
VPIPIERTPVRKTLLALAAVACVVPAFAFAALPKKDSNYAYCENDNSCPLVFDTSATGRKIKNLRMYNRCAQVPPMDGSYPTIRVKDTGKFEKRGTVTDVTGAELTFHIKGKFKRPKKAVGTFEVDSSKSPTPPFRACDSDPEEFVAKRTGPAGSG